MIYHQINLSNIKLGYQHFIDKTTIQIAFWQKFINCVSEVIQSGACWVLKIEILIENGIGKYSTMDKQYLF